MLDTKSFKKFIIENNIHCGKCWKNKYVCMQICSGSKHKNTKKMNRQGNQKSRKDRNHPSEVSSFL